jgi:hypothetical protein
VKTAELPPHRIAVFLAATAIAQPWISVALTVLIPINRIPFCFGGGPLAATIKLLEAWKHVLGLCRVKSGENVVFLLAGHSHADHVHAGRTAATLLGARVLSLELGEGIAATRMAGETTAYLGPTALSCSACRDERRGYGGRLWVDNEPMVIREQLVPSDQR